MQGQCTRCRRPWGGHGKGRRAAAGVGSSYLVRRDLLTKWAPLPAFCCAGWLTRPSGHHGHWTSAGAVARRGGSLGPSKRKSANKGWACRPGGFVSVHSILYAALDVCLRAALSVCAAYRCITVTELQQKKLYVANSNCNCKGSGIERSCATFADMRTWDCLF